MIDRNKNHKLPRMAARMGCCRAAFSSAQRVENKSRKQVPNSISDAIGAKYTQHCMGAKENFTEGYTDKQYHYTLYYYDQGGNLVRTVPPAGVNLLNLTSCTSSLYDTLKYDMTTGQQTVFTNDVLATTYDYNSLNQLGKTPDRF
jgi:hypothetical protein